MDETEDLMLIERCLEGDRAAFEGLVDRYQKAVFNIAFRMVGRFEDAQDIAQTVFLNAYQHLPDYRSEHKFFSWIYRMAMNESIKYLHRRRPLEALHDTMAASAPDPEQMVEANEMRRSIEAVIATLSPDYRAVIILRHFHNLSYAEMAETLGIAEKTVKSRLFSARHLMAERLTEMGVMSHD